MKRYFARFCFATFLVLFVAGRASGQTYSGIVVFGDSLSDTGNYATVYRERALPPPYDGGRFSNGPVWIEVLAEMLHLPAPVASSLGGSNYAWGGGTTGATAGFLPTAVNMDVQVRRYLMAHAPQEGELFVLWGGANDFFGGQENPSLPANRLTNLVSQLAGAGAKQFLVVNLPSRAGIYPEFNERFARLAPPFNEQLRLGLAGLRQNDSTVTIHEFDFFSLYRDIASSPSDFGFAQIVRPACLDCSTWDLRQMPAGHVFGNVVPNPGQYYLWDDVHPSGAAHRLIGETAFAVVVPEPSSLVLVVLGAVMSLCVVRRSTRSRRSPMK